MKYRTQSNFGSLMNAEFQTKTHKMEVLDELESEPQESY
jgi:hypothetical protein